MRKRKSLPCKILSMTLAAVMAFTLLPESMFGGGTGLSKVEAAETVTNPRKADDSSMTSGRKVTWDCVWFGSYPAFPKK